MLAIVFTIYWNDANRLVAVIPYSCSTISFFIIFPRLQYGPTFYSLLSFSHPLSLSPSNAALPSVRIITPFHGDDPLLTRACIAPILCYPLGTCTQTKACAHLKGMCTHHIVTERYCHGVNECPRDSIHRLSVHSTGKILPCSRCRLTSRTQRM